MKGAFIFLVGAGIGASTTWYFTKKHYEKIADEEIKDVVNKFTAYRKELEKTHNEIPDEDPNPNYAKNDRRSNIISVEESIQSDSSEELSNGVIDNPKGIESVTRPYEKEGTMPYIISEDEFGEIEDYDQKTLFWYYRDNILATDEDLEVEDIKTTIGDALDEFKKDRYTERILVRNEEDETDYEVIISEKHFYEVTGGDTE